MMITCTVYDGNLEVVALSYARIEANCQHYYRLLLQVLQGVSIACYACPVLAIVGMSVRSSVCPSHAGTE